MRRLAAGYLALLALLAGCGKAPRPALLVSPSFYYWKTQVKLGADDMAYFQKMGVGRLYLRLFDLAWDDRNRRAVPLGVVRGLEKCAYEGEWVPVVYLKQDLLARATKAGLKALPRQVLRGIAARLPARVRAKVREIQFDCDWTPQTRVAYFGFLKAVEKEAAKVFPTAEISATLRLHQVKYLSVSGVPPVGRATLMIYHTGSPLEPNGRSAILDPREAASYLGGLKEYPLKLDVALPAFSWAVQFNSHGRPLRIINDAGEEDLRAAGVDFAPEGRRGYRAKADFLFKGVRVVKGDLWRVDQPSLDDCRQAFSDAAAKLKPGPLHLIFFSYDPNQLRRLTNGNPENIGKVYLP
jgi:hypothetical protein